MMRSYSHLSFASLWACAIMGRGLQTSGRAHQTGFVNQLLLLSEHYYISEICHVNHVILTTVAGTTQAQEGATSNTAWKEITPGIPTNRSLAVTCASTCSVHKTAPTGRKHTHIYIYICTRQYIYVLVSLFMSISVR